VTDPMENGPQAFFVAMRDSFDRIISVGKGDPRLIDALTAQAFESFDRNAGIQSEGQPEPACARGCDTCCCLHVSATAPEIFLAARFLKLTAPAFARHGVDLAEKLGAAHVATDGKSQQERFASCLMCPFIIGGACAIYSVRTLACRGHVSFDAEACKAAANGDQEVEAMLSSAHSAVRALVQNALQASLRDAGLDWGACEFLAGLARAMQDEDCESRWLRGEPVFADLHENAESAQDMATTFDALRAN
jgi:Fe-S-cluster containining protein